MIVLYEGELYRVAGVKHLTPGNKRGFVQTKLKNLRTGLGTERKFRSEDRVERAVLETRTMQYLYGDGGLHTFMDMESYEQVSLAAEEVGDLLPYLLPNHLVEIEFFEGKPVGVSPPLSVELEVVETEPMLRGATAAASYKPAKLETGITIQVPPCIEIGDRVRVDPASGAYLERVK